MVPLRHAVWVPFRFARRHQGPLLSLESSSVARRYEGCSGEPGFRLRGNETIMTKAEIVQALYARVGGFSKKESADIVDLVFEMLKDTLAKGEKIKISGFGNFVLRDKRQRPGRNPQTGDPIRISERRVLTFKASQILKQALNPRLSSAPNASNGGGGSSASSGTSSGASNLGAANASGGAENRHPQSSPKDG
jgi:integration host factor subunit alpha